VIFLDILLVAAGAGLLHKVFLNFQAASGELALGGERVGQWYRRGIVAMATAIVCLSIVGQHAIERASAAGTMDGIDGQVAAVSAKMKSAPRRFSHRRHHGSKHGNRRVHRSYRHR
jgi:hypothetical protein